MMIKVIAFDLDGVLVDAAELHSKAFRRALKDVAGINMSLEEHQKLYDGLPTRIKLAKLQETNKKLTKNQVIDVEKLKQELTLKMIEEEIKEDPKRTELLQKLYGTFILVCVTNCTHRNAHRLLEQSRLSHYLSMIITSDDVVKPKPSPEGYIKVSQYLEVPPAAILAIEDNQYGVDAALAAGCKTMHIKSYDELTLESIQTTAGINQ